MGKEYYRQRLIDLRTSVQKEKEAKKRDNEHYAALIRGASSPSTKASYRKNKIDRAASHDRAIESLKRQIESTRDQMRRA